MKLKFVGIDRVTKKMRQLSDPKAEALVNEVQSWLDGEAQRLQGKAYPPERPNQRYVRTGNLARSWTSKILSSQATSKALKFLVLLNRATYARYVVDKARQAWMHRGRWWTAQDALDENRQALVDNVADRYQGIWNK